MENGHGSIPTGNELPFKEICISLASGREVTEFDCRFKGSAIRT
jgi:hypothetical protein